MGTIANRINKLEKSLQPKTWEEEARLMVATGQCTAVEMLAECGLIIASRFPEWFTHLSQSEIEEIAGDAEERISGILSQYTDDELDLMLAGKMELPKGL